MKLKVTAVMLFVVLLTACSAKDGEVQTNGGQVNIDTSAKKVAIETVNLSQPNMGKAYSLALDAFLSSSDEGLMRNMKYIAIELSNIPNISPAEKEEVLNDFGKYGVPVMDTTLGELKQEGKLGKAGSLEGVLIIVESVEVTETKVSLKGSIYKSAKGGIGKEVVVENRGGEWQVSKSDDTWIS